MRQLIPALFCALTALPAAAAELHQPVRSTWGGFYVGGHLAGAWGTHDATIIPDIFILPARTTISQSPDGVISGGQVGFNYQTGAWVVGIEGTFSWTDIKGDGRVAAVGFPGATIHTASDMQWLASGVGRLGYARDHSLFYAKGGVAQFEFDFRGSSEFNGVDQGGSSVSDRRTGWTLGAGIEHALSPSWSLRLEYNYFDFGSKVYLFGGDTPVRLEAELHSVQVGVNYRFDAMP